METFVCAVASNKACQAEHLASDLELIPILSKSLAKTHDGCLLGLSAFYQVCAKEPHTDAERNEIIACAGHDLPLLLRVCVNKTSCITLQFLKF